MVDTKIEYVLFDMDGAQFAHQVNRHKVILVRDLGLLIDSERVYTEVTSTSRILRYGWSP